MMDHVRPVDGVNRRHPIQQLALWLREREGKDNKKKVPPPPLGRMLP